jgi:N-acetylmuramoyl-L-alanine amidase
MKRRAIGVALYLMLALLRPAAAQDGPWYDVTCPTGAAEVVLDPGHGGSDPGAVQDTYALYERILTLEVTERAAALLRADGHTVALTREDGAAELANSERGEIANACGASVFAEIHLNASLDTDMDFTQTFWAVREKDLALSRVMLDAMREVGIPVRDVERFDNGGLIRAKMPSVLVETVFLTNGAEAMDLANGTRQESLARAIAAGIERWLAIAAAAPVTPAPPAAASPVAAPASPAVAVSGATPVTPSVGLPADADVGGASQQEWMARSWQWLLAQPIGANPAQDGSGAACGAGQSAPVFFLPTNLPDCAVPAGVPVLVPVVGSICTTADPGAAGDERDLVACAREDADRYTAVRAFVDGVEVTDIDAHRLTTGRFAVDLPIHNVLGAPSGEVEVVASGWQVILPPLPPGEHEVIVHRELADGTVLPDARAVVTVLGT